MMYQLACKGTENSSVVFHADKVWQGHSSLEDGGKNNNNKIANLHKEYNSKGKSIDNCSKDFQEHIFLNEQSPIRLVDMETVKSNAQEEEDDND